MAVYEGKLPVFDLKGKLLCSIRIVTESSSPIDPIRVISEEEARFFGEESFQVLEGTEYEYELDSQEFQIANVKGLIKKSYVGASDGVDRGRIVTGNRTGRLSLKIKQDDIESGVAFVEVRSSKLSYRSDYRKMLKDISELSIDLILSIVGTTESRLGLSHSTDIQSLQQRFFIIKGVIDSDDFQNAVSLILRRPFSRLVGSTELRKISKGARVSQLARSQLVRGSPRIAVPSSHPISKRIGKQFSLPEQVDVAIHEDTFDIPENQFVKFILDEFYEFLLVCKKAFSKNSVLEKIVYREVDPSIERIQRYRSNIFFRRLTSLSYIPVSSSVMQNRAGYRELLRFWVKSKYSIELNWGGLADLFYGGTRDVAKLYECWVFFKLWWAVCNLAGLEYSAMAREIFDNKSDGYILKLKSGSLFKTKGIPILIHGKQISIQFSYNRRFGSSPTSIRSKRLEYETSYPNRGSWTTLMQPDYTISFWPSKYTPREAELNDCICHIHFDAKYRLNKLEDALGNNEEYEGDEFKESVTRNDYKRIDLLKMHAYKDAIRRSQGAYIIYPGRSDERLPYRVWMAFEEVLPGLGAFCIRPGDSELAATDVITSFLKDILDRLAVEKSFS